MNPLIGRYGSDHVLVLVDELPHALAFEFRGRRWAVICLALAVLFGGGLVLVSPYAESAQVADWLR